MSLSSKIERLEKRFHELSLVCYCEGPFESCSACVERIRIGKLLETLDEKLGESQ